MISFSGINAANKNSNYLQSNKSPSFKGKIGFLNVNADELNAFISSNQVKDMKPSNVSLGKFKEMMETLRYIPNDIVFLFDGLNFAKNLKSGKKYLISEQQESRTGNKVFDAIINVMNEAKYSRWEKDPWQEYNGKSTTYFDIFKEYENAVVEDGFSSRYETILDENQYGRVFGTKEVRRVYNKDGKVLNF